MNRIKRIDLEADAAAVNYAMQKHVTNRMTIEVYHDENGWNVALNLHDVALNLHNENPQWIRLGTPMTGAEAHLFLRGMLYVEQEVIEKYGQKKQQP